MKLTINSDIKYLYTKGLVSETCNTVLQCLELKDVFDVMTTSFPSEGDTIFSPSTGPINITDNLKQEINQLITILYKLP